MNARESALTEMKSAIASSEEASSKAKSDLVSTSRRLAVTNEQLVQLQLDLKDKTKDSLRLTLLFACRTYNYTHKYTYM